VLLDLRKGGERSRTKQREKGDAVLTKALAELRWCFRICVSLGKMVCCAFICLCWSVTECGLLLEGGCNLEKGNFSFFSTGAWTQGLHLELLNQTFCDGFLSR
jgi:hypothetical protein